ncbi:MAG: betaine/proline/choline family ABC transporter ATP-binding protein [Desulfohalobiaceae bacterium]|nr:betaine/proline/choline family ABC transporter ATP-binding protein [Desulfohalobiaceae bacterium]
MNLKTNTGNHDQKPVTKLACRNVWKVFGHRPRRFLARHNDNPSDQELAESNYIGAARRVNLDIALGEIFVIMGLSGSGKSTLVRCMSRLHDPTIGEILFDGQDLSTVKEKDLIRIRRHKMGMVFQHFGLLPHRNVLENVAFPLEVQGASKRKRTQRAREVIELVGLEDRMENLPNELSGGEQQRVGIARSLAVEPEVWFLDEPFSALDPLIRSEMQDEFLRLQRLLHKTIVFITHDFDEAIRLADRIAIMKDGEIIQTGTPEELLTNPADAYVKEFTSRIPRGKVISAQAVMDPLPRSQTGSLLQEGCVHVQGEATIEQCAQQVFSQPEPLAVSDPKGEIVGTLTQEAVVETLFADNGSKPEA